MLALNELRGVGKRDWMGLREFSQNRYPKLWKPVEHYFPGGLVNSRRRAGHRPDRGVRRRATSTSSRATRTGSSAPTASTSASTWTATTRSGASTSRRSSGSRSTPASTASSSTRPSCRWARSSTARCFCKDCMKGFRGLPAGAAAVSASSSTAWTSTTFHYGDWLLERGLRLPGAAATTTPLFGEYYRYQCGADQDATSASWPTTRASTAASRAARCSSPATSSTSTRQYLALADDVDLVITEMRNTTYRQPEWYRYVAGFAGDKDVVVVENPYGGVVPELIGRWRGQGARPVPAVAVRGGGARREHERAVRLVDGQRDRGLVLRAARAVRRDPGLPRRPRAACSRADHTRSPSSTASRPLAEPIARRDEFADNRTNAPRRRECRSRRAAEPSASPAAVRRRLLPRRRAARRRARRRRPEQYRTLVLPDCDHLTAGAGRGCCGAYLDAGGELVEFPAAADPQLVVTAGETDFAVCVQRVAGGRPCT